LTKTKHYSLNTIKVVLLVV